MSVSSTHAQGEIEVPEPGPARSRWSSHRGAWLIRLYRSQPLYVWLFLLGLTGNMLSGHSHRLGLPISPDRVLIPLAIVLLLVDPHRPRLRTTLVHWLMGLFVVWTLMSMIWYDNLLDSVSLFALLDRTALPFLMFVLGPVLFPDQARRDLLLKTLTLTGLYLGVSAVLETFAPGLVFPRYIVDPAVGLHPGRARGLFASSEAMAMALAVCAGAAAVLATRRLPRWRALGVAVFVLNLLGVVLTTTRSVWVGVGAGVVVVLVLAPPVRRWIPALLASGAAAGGAVVAFMPATREELLGRATEVGPVYDRLSSNAAALRLLQEQPLTGIGWRRFYPHGAEWARQSDTLPMNNAVIEVHNVLLSRAAELGVPAALVFIALIALGPLRGAFTRSSILTHPDLTNWKILSAAVFTVWLVAGMFGPMATPFPNFATWLIAGVAAREGAEPRPSRPSIHAAPAHSSGGGEP